MKQSAFSMLETLQIEPVANKPELNVLEEYFNKEK